MNKLFRTTAFFIVSLLLCSALYLWTSLQNSLLELPSKKNPVLLYSTECNDDLLLLHCKALQKAKKSIHLTIYALTDPHIVKILNSKAAEGLKVAVYFDPSASGELQKKLHPKIDYYPVVMSGLMHRKILIIDHKKVFLGSANMTPQSLQIHGNIVAGIRDRPLATEMEKEGFSAIETHVEEQTVNVYFLPETGKSTLKKMKEMILSAKKIIHVAMFTLTHPELLEALKVAHQRGVQVGVAIDDYTAKGASRSALKILQKAGIPTYIGSSQKLLHHKWMWIDEETLVFGSANWTKAAFQKNKDCVVVMTPLKEAHKKTMHTLWDVLQLEGQKQTPLLGKF